MFKPIKLASVFFKKFSNVRKKCVLWFFKFVPLKETTKTSKVRLKKRILSHAVFITEIQFISTMQDVVYYRWWKEKAVSEYFDSLAGDVLSKHSGARFTSINCLQALRTKLLKTFPRRLFWSKPRTWLAENFNNYAFVWIVLIKNSIPSKTTSSISWFQPAFCSLLNNAQWFCSWQKLFAWLTLWTDIAKMWKSSVLSWKTILVFSKPQVEFHSPRLQSIPLINVKAYNN